MSKHSRGPLNHGLSLGAVILIILIGNALAQSVPDSATNGPMSELKQEQDKLTAENGIADQKLRKELSKMTAEKQRLELQNSLAQQRLQAESASMQAEIDKLSKQIDLLAKQSTLKEAERRAKLDDELRDTREMVERIKLTNDMATAELAAKSREMTQHEQELRVKMAELQTRTAEMAADRAELDLKLGKLNTQLDLREKQDQWKNRVNHDIVYTKTPFNDGVLTISDRRISLNGPITLDTADYIAERIDYYNNQNQEFPIFLVIDRSPGGSVMAGYKILKAMSDSPAPVYVVVKSFAASMAAGITTLAKKSFAYPNAIILHHQILSSAFGNLTEHREHIKELEEWWQRLSAPVAAKMGISLDEFIKQMYSNRSSGDWQEFGDGARKLKWVDEIAESVREESYDKNPDQSTGPHSPPRIAQGEVQSGLQERIDSNGRRYMLLPRLEPVDCYYLYNPDSYYRLNP
jgi:ATP-dependent Clp protease protease subunit